MNNLSTVLMRFVVVGIVLLAVAVSSLLTFIVHSGWAREMPEYANLRYPLIAIFLLNILPVIIAGFQLFTLLGYIDKKKAFSKLSIQAVKKIKYAMLTMTGLYALVMPAVYLVADKDDAPGLVLIGMLFVCAPLSVAIFASVVQGLFQNAIDLKTENDLTV